MLQHVLDDGSGVLEHIGVLEHTTVKSSAAAMLQRFKGLLGEAESVLQHSRSFVQLDPFAHMSRRAAHSTHSKYRNIASSARNPLASALRPEHRPKPSKEALTPPVALVHHAQVKRPRRSCYPVSSCDQRDSRALMDDAETSVEERKASRTRLQMSMRS